jgi:hypothetical protein
MKYETSGSKNEYDKFRKEISLLPDNAFDGHTCFKELTPQQRLDWLAELVVFVYEAGRVRSSLVR